MEINEVRYDRQFNLGNYESEKIGLTAKVDEGESALEVIGKCRLIAEGKEDSPAEKKPEETVAEPVVAEKPVTKKKASKKVTKKAPAKKETLDTTEDFKDDEYEDDTTPPQEDVVGQTEETVEDEVEKPASKKKVAKKTTTKKKVVKKVTAVPYSRIDSAHKKRLGELINTVLDRTDWRKDKAALVKVKDASIALDGSDFIGKDGEILEEFKTALKEKLA